MISIAYVLSFFLTTQPRCILSYVFFFSVFPFSRIFPDPLKFLRKLETLPSTKHLSIYLLNYQCVLIEYQSTSCMLTLGALLVFCTVLHVLCCFKQQQILFPFHSHARDDIFCNAFKGLKQSYVHFPLRLSLAPIYLSYYCRVQKKCAFLCELWTFLFVSMYV